MTKETDWHERAQRLPPLTEEQCKRIAAGGFREEDYLAGAPPENAASLGIKHWRRGKPEPEIAGMRDPIDTSDMGPVPFRADYYLKDRGGVPPEPCDAGAVERFLWPAKRSRLNGRGRR